MSWLEAAESIQGWMVTEELQWLHDTAAQMSSVVEVGCWKGRSTYALASGCPGAVYAVDHFRGSDEPEHTVEVARLGGSVLNSFLSNIRGVPNVVPIVADSLGAAKRIPAADMVFIDASHDYDSVRADIAAWKPKAKRLLCGHDADYPGVKRAVEELLGPVMRGAWRIWIYPICPLPSPNPVPA